MAMATTGSPNTPPHSAKPRFEVRIMALFSYRALTSQFGPPGSRRLTRLDHGSPARRQGRPGLEEQVAAAGHDGRIADQVNHQERGATQRADALAKRAVALGPGAMR